MSKAHIFSKCTQNITRIVICFTMSYITSYNEHSNLPPTLQAQQLPTAMLLHVYFGSGKELIDTSMIQVSVEHVLY